MIPAIDTIESNLELGPSEKMKGANGGNSDFSGHSRVDDGGYWV